MKKKLLPIIITLAAATLILLILACCKLIRDNSNYTVKFYVDGEYYSNFTAKYWSDVETPEMETPDDDGNVFIGWFTNKNYQEWYPEKAKLTKNVSVYGYWIDYEASLVSITFYDDDGEVIEGYPTKVQIGDCVESYPLPDTDDGYRLAAWLVDEKPYDFSTRVLTDLEFYPTRKPAEYTVEFISLDDVISTQIYTVENYNIKVPACPDRKHYYPGEWESYELTMGDIQVHAIYEPITYTVEYVDGSGTVLGKYDYNILTYKDVVPPEPTPVPGCYSYFDDLECGVTLLRQKVTALNYTIEYFVEEESIATFETTIKEFYKLVPPEIPEVDGYTASWESYKLQLETYIRVNAVYDLITYYVSFVADDEVVDVAEYNVENTQVEIPDIPDKAGYTSRWEHFELVIGDVTVNALFTPINYTASFIAYDELIGTEYSLTYTTTFNAENMKINFPTPEHYPEIAGCAVKWDNPELSFEDITISGYYYDVDYTYLDFVQVIITEHIEIEDEDKDEDKDETESDGDSEGDGEGEEGDKNEEETDKGIDIIVDRYFYVKGLATNAGSTANVVIPATYHGIPVRYVQAYAFDGANIKTLEICAIERIENHAFCNCTSIQSVILHDGIQIIEQFAFSGCEALATIKIPDSVTEIGNGAFYLSGLVSVTLPKDIDKIPDSAFQYCFNLLKITIPESVTEIGEYAFERCTSLTSVTMGPNIEVIKKSAFAYCASLKEITIPAKVYLIESNNFAGCTSLVAIYVSGSDWYCFTNNDFNDMQSVPDVIINNGTELATTLTQLPIYGLYRKINI